MEMSLQQIAGLVDGELLGEPRTRVAGVAPFEAAGPAELTWAGTPAFLRRIHATGAGAVIVPARFEPPRPLSGKNLIRVDNPQVAFIKVIEVFHPPRRPAAGISAAAVIGKNFACGAEASIGAMAVIQDNVTLGDRVVVHPHVFIGSGVTIGDDTVIHPQVAILEGTCIGSRVIVHAGTVIGSDGFGQAPDGAGYRKIPHLGKVQIDDDVEIGACNAIDRATFGRTWIQNGVKTDNLVHIAHNVVVGENTVLVAQVGISGSVTIGRHAILAGQAGVSGHLSIGDNAVIGPQAGVAKSVPADAVVSGTPEMPHPRWLRVSSLLPRLPEMKRELADLQRRLKALEDKEKPPSGE